MNIRKLCFDAWKLTNFQEQEIETHKRCLPSLLIALRHIVIISEKMNVDRQISTTRIAERTANYFIKGVFPAKKPTASSTLPRGRCAFDESTFIYSLN